MKCFTRFKLCRYRV